MTEAVDGAAALAPLAVVPPPTVVVLDVKLPDMSGLAVLEEIRRRRPDVAVVMMTAYWASEALEQARRLGVRDLLAKPLDLDLAAAVAVVAAPKEIGTMLTLTHILCPTDFSDVSTRAEALATALGRVATRRRSICCTSTRPCRSMSPYGEIPVDIRLFEDQRAAGGAGSRRRPRAGPGGRRAGRRPSSRRLPGPRNPGGGRRGARGSRSCSARTAAAASSTSCSARSPRRCMRKAPCPVMVVPAGATVTTDAGTEVRFSRILCPIDGSASSAEAVSYAVSLARETDGRLTLLSRRGAGARRPANSGRSTPASIRRLGEAHAKARAAGRPHARRARVVQGRGGRGLRQASDGILATATSHDADVIVMGVRGRGAIDMLAFGSTTNEVIRRATCPVLAVHPFAKDHRHLAAVPVPV